MKVAAIVPAYNEERTICGVVGVLKGSPLIDEVIVISDGSMDNTAPRAQEMGVTVVELRANVGKGGAMKAGVARTDAEVILFIDADLIGLTETHIRQLVLPVIDGKVEMTVGVFEEGRFATDLAQKLTPFLSGQRAVTRSLFDKIPELEESRYGVEMALSRYVDRHNIKASVVQLPGLSQVMKEEKHGFLKGFCARLQMYWDIVRNIRI